MTLPLGELHSPRACAYCGMHGTVGDRLKIVTLAVTRAEAPICVDTTGCMRRLAKKRGR